MDNQKDNIDIVDNVNNVDNIDNIDNIYIANIKHPSQIKQYVECDNIEFENMDIIDNTDGAYEKYMLGYLLQNNEEFKLNMTRSDLHDIKNIGEGSFGTVYLCDYTRSLESTKEKCALKIINKTPSIVITDVHIEIFIQHKSTHSNILKCNGWFEDKHNYYIVLDYIKGSDLFYKMIDLI